MLDGPGVDFDAVDRQRNPEAFTGNVAAGMVRKLAFVLLTAQAPHRMQLRLDRVDIPDALPVTFSTLAPNGRIDVEPDVWGSSEQTSISFALVDEGGLRADGHFTRPYSHAAAEVYADDLIRILEAGLEPGCARAKLPARLGRGITTSASSIDADPARQVGVAGALRDDVEPKLRAEVTDTPPTS